jgi:hypothetical protein
MWSGNVGTGYKNIGRKLITMGGEMLRRNHSDQTVVERSNHP